MVVGYGLGATIAFGYEAVGVYAVGSQIQADDLGPLLGKLAVQLGAALVVSVALYFQA